MTFIPVVEASAPTSGMDSALVGPL